MNKSSIFTRETAHWTIQTRRGTLASTLEKLKRLERYLSSDVSVDPVLDTTIDKLLAREIANIRETQKRLQSQLSEFEIQYHLKSDVFYKQYQNGELDDKMDFLEWASTVEMMEKSAQRLKVLDLDSALWTASSQNILMQ